MDYSPPDSFVRRISQARILEWVAISFSRGSSQPSGLNLHLLYCGQNFYFFFFLTTEPPGKPFYIFTSVQFSSVTQSCPTLCDPMNCSLPGCSVHGILQARMLEWVAISFSRGSSQPRNQTQVSCIAGRFFTNWVTREAPSGLRRSQIPVLYCWF